MILIYPNKMKKISLILVAIMLFSCKESDNARKPVKQVTIEQNWTDMQKKLSKYTTFKLTSNLSVLTENERKMLPSLIKAASIMNKSLHARQLRPGHVQSWLWWH